MLKVLDRTHSVKNVFSCAKWAKEEGIEFSFDLIYGTPNETLDSWRRTIEHTIDLGPNHISAYALTIEEGTKMHRQIKRVRFRLLIRERRRRCMLWRIAFWKSVDTPGMKYRTGQDLQIHNANTIKSTGAVVTGGDLAPVHTDTLTDADFGMLNIRESTSKEYVQMKEQILLYLTLRF